MRKTTMKMRQFKKSLVLIPKGQVRKEVLKLSKWQSRIVLEPGSKATIFERDIFPSSGGEKRGPFDVDVTIGERAELHYVVLVNGGEGTSKIRRRSTVEEGGVMHWHIVTLGGHGDRHELVSMLAGKNATSSIDWIFFVCGDEKQCVSACMVFAAPGGRGEITMKGIAQDHGYIQCDGRIEISERGSGVETFLTQKFLLLDPTAKIDAGPALKIKTDNVKASHSATVSRVTPDDLFYMKSRGLDESSARKMFVEGFLSDLTEKLPDELIRGKILGAIREAYER